MLRLWVILYGHAASRYSQEEKRRDCVVSDLEQQEEDAVERLRRTQEAQKRAYEELERALVNPPPPLDQREAALGNILDSGLDDNSNDDD